MDELGTATIDRHCPFSVDGQATVAAGRDSDFGTGTRGIWYWRIQLDREPKYLYRYDYTRWDTPRLVLEKYPILRETPKGYWIDSNRGYWPVTEKWVAAGAGGFAQETPEAALRRFIRRKRNYRAILGSRHDETTAVIKQAEIELAKMTGRDTAQKQDIYKDIGLEA